MHSIQQREELIEIAKAWVDLWSAPVDWIRFDQLHAYTFIDHSSAGRPQTKQGFADGLASMINAFPDIKTVVTDLVVDEPMSKVAVRWKAVGTNREKYLGVGPTHRQTTITGIEIIEIHSGKIVNRWGEWDITGHIESH
jgi:steroid delta-isomerase-like uncharacterized protein